MANEKNLRPVRNKKEARERGKVGGKQSGKVRKANKEKRWIIDRVMETTMPVDKKNKLINQFQKKGKISIEEAMVLKQAQKAIEGNFYPYKDFMDRKHGMATQKIEHSGEIEIKRFLESLND